MKPFYYFENHNIHIQYMPDNNILTEKNYEIKLINILRYLEKEAGIPKIIIKDEKINIDLW